MCGCDQEQHQQQQQACAVGRRKQEWWTALHGGVVAAATQEGQSDCTCVLLSDLGVAGVLPLAPNRTGLIGAEQEESRGQHQGCCVLVGGVLYYSLRSLVGDCVGQGGWGGSGFPGWAAGWHSTGINQYLYVL